jgi:hypothetical protein
MSVNHHPDDAAMDENKTTPASDTSSPTGTTHNSGIQILDFKHAIEKIYDTVRLAKTGEAPFALALGSGFSHGSFPLRKNWWRRASRFG